MRRVVTSVGAVLAAGMVQAAEPLRELNSGTGDREAVAVTVYNDDLALVKERRRVDLPAGLSRLSLRGVTAQMRPETALLRAVSGQPLNLIEQNFDFDLLTPQKLLEKYVGREVTVIRPHPTSDAERREKATVLAAGQAGLPNVVLRFADRIETGVPGRLAFDSVPTNLRDRPTLSVLLDAGGGKQAVELSYLTGGLSWKADYVANLSVDGKSLDLNGWVTLTNRSGAGFGDSTLQLVAGSVNRVRRPQAQMAYAMAPARAKAAEATQEALLDYHLYSFERPTSIADNQTKQLALLSASAVPVRRKYLLAGNEYYYRGRYGQIGREIKPAVFIEFENGVPVEADVGPIDVKQSGRNHNKGGQLGKPLPAGIIRVYAKDSKGAAQFVGEDRIGHTAKNEKLKLRLGEAFDITADRKQTNYKRIADNNFEVSFRIELRNAMDEAVTVKVQEPLPGEWEIVQETHKHTKESASVLSWNIGVPAGGSTVLEYTVRVRW